MAMALMVSIATCQSLFQNCYCYDGQDYSNKCLCTHVNRHYCKYYLFINGQLVTAHVTIKKYYLILSCLLC